MRLLTGFFLLCISAITMASELSVHVMSPRVRETLPAQTVASAYFTVMNHGDKDVLLVSARSDRSPRVEIHEHRHDNGMMQMRKLESLVIPAHGQQVFQSGGLHLMLMDLPAPLKAGETVSVVLQFGDGAELELLLPVQTLQETLQPAPAAGHMHH